MDSMMQQQELFATLSDTDTLDGLLKTCTVQVVDRFGWTTFDAMTGTLTSRNVDTVAGVVTTVHTMTMFPSHVSSTRLKQLLSLEEETRALDVLKCFTVLSGEPFVMMDSLTQQQELSASLLDSGMSEEKLTLTAMAWATGSFGLTTSPAVGQNNTSASVHTATGQFTGVHTTTMSPSPASITRQQPVRVTQQRQSLQ